MGFAALNPSYRAGVDPGRRLSAISDEIDRENEKRAIEKARTEIAAGKGVPHERVRQWLERLREGKIEPPPCA